MIMPFFSARPITFFNPSAQLFKPVSNLQASSKLAQDVEKIGASAILVGGSSANDQKKI